jgi:hypothetical protein
MKTLREIGPIAVATVLVGGVTWMLLEDGSAIGQWLLAGIVAAHGLLHLMFLAPAPAVAATPGGTTWAFDLGHSWLIGGPGVDRGVVRNLAIILISLTMGSSLLGALAIVGIIVPAGWWAALLTVAALSSLGLLAIGFVPMLLVGVAIDIALLCLVFLSGWEPAG